MNETKTTTQVSTQTKVIVGFMLAGTAIAAFGAGVVFKFKINGTTVVKYNSGSNSTEILPVVNATLNKDYNPPLGDPNTINGSKEGETGETNGNTNGDTNASANTNGS